MGTVKYFKLALGPLVAVAALAAHADRIELETAYGRCSVDTLGARVVSYRGPEGDEVLWDAGETPSDDVAWSHGGIPLCSPWFSCNSRGEFHGSAWRRPFQVVRQAATADTAELVLRREDKGFAVECRIRLRDTLKVEMTTTNTGDNDLEYSAGIHPYFRVSERDRVSVGGVTPELISFRTLDDGFPLDGTSCGIARLHDKGLNRTIFVFCENAEKFNLWNPGPAKLCPGRIAGDDWRHFVCVEPVYGSAKRPKRLARGASHTLMLGIDVRPGAAATGFVGSDARKPNLAEAPTGRPFHVLYLGAHPDDGDYDYAAQFVKLIRAGAKVTCVALCNGCKGHVEMPPEALAARRLNEAQSAARVYGLERYIVMNSPDCELEPTRAWRERLGRLIRNVAPDMILAHRTVDYHADHRAVGLLVRDCCYLLGVPHWCPDTPVPAIQPFVMNAVDCFAEPRLMRLDLVMSAAGALEEGARGLACHESQLFEWMPVEMGDDPKALTTPAARQAYALRQLTNFYTGYANAHRDEIEKLYGRRDELVSYAELSEYSRVPSAREIKFLESIPGFKWTGLYKASTIR